MEKRESIKYSIGKKDEIMRILVIGAGKIGSVLIEYLAREGHNVTFIDTDAQLVESLVNRFDVMGIVGNGASPSVQIEAGVKNTDLVIMATSSDEFNMLCTVIAKKLGAHRAAARIRDPDYAKQAGFLYDAIQLDLIINPELQTADEISRILNFPSAIHLETFAKGRVDMAEVKVPEDCPFAGMTLSYIRKNRHTNVLVCAAVRGKEVVIPDGNFTLQAGDRIYITAAHPELIDFLKNMGLYRQKLHHIFLIGGGRIGYYLAKRLIELGMDVTVVERDRQICQALTESVPRARIVCGDGTDQDLLREECFEKADACVSITGIDEENIVVSLYAHKQGIKKIITKISKRSLIEMLGGLELDSVVSPKMVTAAGMLRYARAMQNSEGSDMLSLYKLAGEEVEALEFLVGREETLTEKPLRDLQLRRGILIACIIRKMQVIFPAGSDTIQPGDRVILVARSRCIRTLNDILA